MAKQPVSTMLDDDRLTAALGLPRTTRISRTASRTGLAVRNGVYRHRPPKRQAHFTPGEAGSTICLNGYSLEQIGPVNVPATASQGAWHSFPR